MNGTWNGYYKYDKKQARGIRGFDQTNFTIIIHSFDGKKFEGKVTDDLHSGGMEGEGQIVGEIEDNKISFQKHMPRRTFVFKDGSRKIQDRRHPTIYYSGIISQEGTRMEGRWKFRTQIVFLFGIIPFPVNPNKGTWSMQLQQNNQV